MVSLGAVVFVVAVLSIGFNLGIDLREKDYELGCVRR